MLSARAIEERVLLRYLLQLLLCLSGTAAPLLIFALSFPLLPLLLLSSLGMFVAAVTVASNCDPTGQEPLRSNHHQCSGALAQYHSAHYLPKFDEACLGLNLRDSPHVMS